MVVNVYWIICSIITFILVWFLNKDEKLFGRVLMSFFAALFGGAVLPIFILMLLDEKYKLF